MRLRSVWVMCGLAVACWIGPASGQPAPPLSAEQQQQLRDLRALIEGPNTRSARMTGARQLLRLEWVPDATIVNLLSNPQADSQRALAGALAELPNRWRPAVVEPLVAMIRSEDELLRSAAGDALAQGPFALTVPAVGGLLQADDVPRMTREQGLEILARIPAREALAYLIEVATRDSDPLRGTAWRLLQRAGWDDLPEDPSGLPAWWQSVQAQPREVWQQAQLQRMRFGQQRLQRRVRDLENRLSATLRDAYLRLPDTEKEAVLVGHLGDPTPVVRLLGLELVQATLAEGREPSAELEATTRGLLRDSDPVVRGVAVQTVSLQRKADDEQTFLSILPGERDSEVLRALINGLGYVGTRTSVDHLLTYVGHPDVRTADEAVGSLGRLAERGVLEGDEHRDVADALLQRFSVVRNQNGHEARVVWAMGQVADDRFAEILIEVSRSATASATRLAGLRAMASLARREPPLPSRPAVLQAIAVGVQDDDDAIRRVAIETLVPLATVAELDALCARLDPDVERDDNLRRSAWQAVRRLLPTLDAGTLPQRVDQLRSALRNDSQRMELLQLACEAWPADASPGTRGAWESELVPLLVKAGKLPEALQTARAALSNQHKAGVSDLALAAQRVLDLSLQSGGYDETIAAELNAANPLLDLDALWQRRCERIRDLLKDPTMSTALAMLGALDAHPPEKLSESAREVVRTMRREAEDRIRATHRQQVDAALVKLRENPDNEAAEAEILALGSDAIIGLRAALRRILEVEPLDREAEQRVYELLQRVHPDWSGYAPDASLEEKQGAVAG